MRVDYRSDTVTKPTPEMLSAMMAAEVGDDIFNEDPTINALQQKAAEMFGMDVGMFCPSGTMANQIAIRLLTRPQDQVICHKYAHIYLYEGGGSATHSGITTRILEGDRGRIRADEVEANINPRDIHQPETRLVSLENTANKGGGSCYPMEWIDEIVEVCQKHSLKLHLDGARLCNALIATHQDPKEYGKKFETISLCLSKGLGAPVGTVLLMKEEYYWQALRIRKMFGGGMRQAGYLAAAGLYALEHHVERLADDHKRAKILGDALAQHPKIASVMPIETNILIFEPDTKYMDNTEFIHQMAQKDIHMFPFGANYVRMVTHLDIDDTMIDYTLEAIKQL